MSPRRPAGAHPAPPTSVDDVLDHFVTGFEWAIPTNYEIDPDGYALGYEVPLRPPFARVHAGPGLLEGFIKLADAPDEAILAYARRWGPLWLCKHGDPFRSDIVNCGPFEFHREIDPASWDNDGDDD